MKLQDKHKQFTVNYDVRSLVYGVSISFFMQKTLHTLMTMFLMGFCGILIFYSMQRGLE